MPEFQFTTLLPTAGDNTAYRLVTKDHVKTIDVDGETFLKVDPEGLRLLAHEAMRDIAHLCERATSSS